MAKLLEADSVAWGLTTKFFRAKFPLNAMSLGGSVSDQSPSIPDLLVKNLDRDLLLAVEDAFHAGASRAFNAAQGMKDGHLPSVLGQLRHFHLNEGYADALSASGVHATPLRGNSVVVGTSGMVALGRFNLSQGIWNHARRSKSRRVMARANAALESVMLGDLFGDAGSVTSMAAFFVCVFSSNLKVSPNAPLSIEIAVPDKEMKGWLFREPLTVFASRYEKSNNHSSQPDNAFPVLRKKKPNTGTGSDSL